MRIPPRHNNQQRVVSSDGRRGKFASSRHGNRLFQSPDLSGVDIGVSSTVTSSTYPPRYDVDVIKHRMEASTQPSAAPATASTASPAAAEIEPAVVANDPVSTFARNSNNFRACDFRFWRYFPCKGRKSIGILTSH